MKPRQRGRLSADFHLLRRKIFFQTVILFLTAILVIIAVYMMFLSGRFAEWTVRILEKILFQDYGTASRIFQSVFRNHIGLWFVVAVLMVFLASLVIYLNFFTRYLNEINRGIDTLLDDDSGDMVLSPELSPTERKLNHIKRTLKDRDLAVHLAEQRKNDMVMYLAHDIRTPLTSVIGYLSLLDEAPDMPVEQKAKYTHIALDKAYRLETLVNEFFEITRYNFQQVELQKENIDLYYMLVQLKDEFYPILSARGNTAILCADESLSVSGDPVKLARVFNNILKNAAAYSDPGSSITITAERRDGMVKIEFQNCGPTIPSGKLSAIFEKFYRLDDARATDKGGSGLGLAIAKEIVTLHGGTIAARSADGVTVFTVALPAS